MMNKDYPLTCVVVVAIVGMVASVVCGTAIEKLFDMEPVHYVEATRVIYDGAYEKHVELVQLEVKGEF